MLEVYRNYLECVHDSLIQNGVMLEKPSLAEDDYLGIFRWGAVLDEVLWYYDILGLGGSGYALGSFLLPIGGSYVGRMRGVFRREWAGYAGGYWGVSRRGLLSARLGASAPSAVSGGSMGGGGSMGVLGASGGIRPVAMGVWLEDFVSGCFLGESLGTFLDDFVIPGSGSLGLGIFLEDWSLLEEPCNDLVPVLVEGTFLDEWEFEDVKHVANNKITWEKILGTFLEDWILPKVDNAPRYYGIYLDEWEVPSASVSFTKSIVEGTFLDDWEPQESVVATSEEISGTFLDDWEPEPVKSTSKAKIEGTFLDDWEISETHGNPAGSIPKNVIDGIYLDDWEILESKPKANLSKSVLSQKVEGIFLDDWNPEEGKSSGDDLNSSHTEDSSPSKQELVQSDTILDEVEEKEDLAITLNKKVNSLLTMGKRFLYNSVKQKET